MKHMSFFLAAVLLLSCANNNKPDTPKPDDNGSTKEEFVADPVGQQLSAWKEGLLDIHFINTTTGECTFIIFPDGTQMLVDAAGSKVETGQVNSSTTNTGIRSRWDPTKDSSFSAAKFIADYVRHCMAWTQNNSLDYVLVTHFHGDHMGAMAELLDLVPAKKIMDRGWPDYNYPFDMQTKASNSGIIKTYVKSVKTKVSGNTLAAEMFKAGSADQVVLLKNAAAYPAFKFQNIAVNGEIWDGQGTTTATATFPALKDIVVADPKNVGNDDNCPEENHCTTAFKLSYGSFDFYHAGDAQYDGCSTYVWKDMETPTAQACGAVDVMKADHHGVTNTNGYGYKAKNGHVCEAMKYLNPRCWIVNSWTDGHPRQKTYEGVTGLLPAMDIFITNTCSDMQAYNNFNQVKGCDGHIVVRVAKGGAKYCVYVISDSDGKNTVKKAAGPYHSR